MQLSLFEWIALTDDDFGALADLPFHHRDPFDRLLVAQAMHHGLAIVSADTVFDAYPVSRLWR